MTKADLLIGEVLKESLLRDVTRGVGAYMVGRAAYKATSRVMPKIASAVTSPAAKSAARAAGRAVVAAAPTVGKAAMVGIPIAAGLYAMRKADQATSRRNEAFDSVTKRRLMAENSMGKKPRADIELPAHKVKKPRAGIELPAPRVKKPKENRGLSTEVHPISGFSTLLNAGITAKAAANPARIGPGRVLNAVSRGNTMPGTAAGAAVEFALLRSGNPYAMAAAPVAGAVTTYGVDKYVQYRREKKATPAPEEDEN